MRLLLLLLLSAALLPAADVAQRLMDADRAFDAATAQNGLDGWMSFFAEDARLNHRSGEIAGKADLRKFYAGMFALKQFSLRWQPLHAEASKDGTLGYTYGASQMSYADEEGKPVKREGRYLTVWRRQRDGSWKVSTDLGN